MLKDMQALATVLKKHPVGYLVRHAHRFAIPMGSCGDNIYLTPQGKEEAQRLACILKPYLVEVYSSPVLRCVETGQYLQSQSKTGNLIQHKYFGAPGIYIEDEKAAGPLFLQMTSDEIVFALVRGKIFPGFLNIFRASQNLLTTMLSAMNKGAGLYPFVSHDHIISLFLSSFLQREDCKILWPTYLEGVFIWFDGASINFRFRSEHYMIDLKNIQNDSIYFDKTAKGR